MSTVFVVTGIIAAAGLTLLTALLTVRAWRSPGGIRSTILWAIGATAVFILLDWRLVSALAPLGLSFGPEVPYIVILAVVRIGVLALYFFVSLLVLLVPRRRPANQATSTRRQSSASSLALVWAVHLLILGSMTYASFFEPFRLTVTELELTVAPSVVQEPLRIVQLTDTHVERTTKREREVVARVADLEPDLIVFTGDYLNLANLQDPLAQNDVKELIAQLHAPYGIYAVDGTVESPEELRKLVAGLDVVVLDDDVAAPPVEGTRLYLVGLSNQGWERDRPVLPSLMEQVPENAHSLLLYHTPDMIEEASAAGVDLYLCGHTHGGQVRMPFYGAIFTASRYGKDYEQGLYHVGPTTLYVSRGLGMEGFTATPRVRFLCPPEIVVIDLIPEDAP